MGNGFHEDVLWNSPVILYEVLFVYKYEKYTPSMEFLRNFAWGMDLKKRVKRTSLEF